MKVSNIIQACVSKIVKKQRFVKDIFTSIFHQGGKVILVGGVVRDLFLQKSIKDIDIEVYGLSLEQLQNVLQEYGVVSLVGKSFGVLRLHGLDIDWSLPRQDSSGRHPIVAYDSNMSFQQAFIRRDLTINAMGIDIQTFELIDLYHGLQDLHDKILRSPDLGFFAEDPLRLLRVMQFAGRFEMTVDENLSRLCMTMDMSSVSQERIEQEFIKLFLQSSHPSLGLKWLLYINKFHEFLPGVQVNEQLFIMIDTAAQLTNIDDQEKLVIIWSIVSSSINDDFEAEKVLCKQATYDDTYKITKFMKQITRNQNIIEQVAHLVWYNKIIDESLTDVQLKWLAVWIAPKTSLRILIQFAALKNNRLHINVLLNKVEQLGIADNPIAPLLTGKDFLDIASGVTVGILVKKAYQIQIDQGLVDRSVLKNMVIKTTKM